MKDTLKNIGSFTLVGLLLAGLLSTPLAAAGSESSEKPIKMQGVIIECQCENGQCSDCKQVGSCDVETWYNLR